MSEEKLKEAFNRLSEHTSSKCGSCMIPYRCCTKENCQATKELALTLFNIHLEETGTTLPFLGENGCTVAPHHRPICTVHVCEAHFGKDPEWDEKYWDLREETSNLLEEHAASSS